ncbi:MAG TPA: hypothetical protein VMV13_08465 [Candidatus Binataceae bacterium]|nr:hypothetical protein [Candidatus Binataceae bacterium]
MNSHSQIGGGTGPARRTESMLRYSPALVLIAVMIADSVRIADPDLYGHLRFGQQILLAARVPRFDTYSYSITGLRWISHEWLSDVLLSWVYLHGGVVGLKLMKLGCTGAIVVLLLEAMRETGASAVTQISIMLVAGIRLSAQMQFRPQIFTYLLLAALLMLLTRDNFRGRAALWTTIPMFALWANLHGGFVIGLGVMGLYAIVRGGQEIAAGRGTARFFHLAAVTSACVVATLLTPYGVGSWLSVFHTIGNPAMLRAINEWQPLLSAMLAEYHSANTLFVYDISMFGIFFGALAAIAFSPSTDDLALIAIAAVLVASAFVQVRNVPLGMMAAMIPLARHATLALRARRTPRSIGAVPPRPISLLGQIILSIAAVALAAETGLFSGTLGLTEPYPSGALAFMRAHGLSGNMLCEYSWNDYVIFHEWPRDKVFLDSRFEMIYPRPIIEAYLAFTFDRAGAAQTLAGFPNDFVLINPTTVAADVMASAAKWTLIYSDSDSFLYARRDSGAARIAGAPVRGTALAPIFP